MRPNLPRWNLISVVNMDICAREAAKVVTFMCSNTYPLFGFYADGKLARTVYDIRQYHVPLCEPQEALKINQAVLGI